MPNKNLSTTSPSLLINSLKIHILSIGNNDYYIDTINKSNSILDYWHLITEINKSFGNLSFLKMGKPIITLITTSTLVM